MMDSQTACAVQLSDELESWTRAAASSLRSASADGLLAFGRRQQRTAVRQALVAAVRQVSTSRLQLARLPARILGLTCQYLPLKDRIALSHTSRDLRTSLLNLPSVWSNMDSREPRTETIELDLLQALAKRSGDNQLALSVTLDDGNAFPGLTKVSLLLHRISSLTLRIKYEEDIGLASTSEPSIWKAILDTLLTPAPHLKYFNLIFAERISRMIDDLPGPVYYWHQDNDAPLSSTIFAGRAPLLRTLRLTGVRLPTMACQSFLSVTCFHLSWAGHIDEVVRAVDMMPQLETLILQAAFLPTTPLIGRRSRRPTSRSLRNLLLHADEIDPASICSVLDFRRLRFLDIDFSQDAGALVAEAYPTPSMTRLVIAFIGNVITVVDEAGNLQTTIRAYHVHSSMPPMLEACYAVTWLAVHESHWPGNGVWQVLPVMPAVTTVLVYLAACREDLDYRVGVLVHCEPGSAWHLPALRKLCITAPRACPEKHSTCLGTRSVALADVARFVRLGVQFDAPRLDEVRLAGLRLIDPDFCAAWEEISACALAVELVEQPELIPHMDLSFNYNYDVETLFSGREI